MSWEAKERAKPFVRKMQKEQLDNHREAHKKKTNAGRTERTADLSKRLEETGGDENWNKHLMSAEFLEQKRCFFTYFIHVVVFYCIDVLKGVIQGHVCCIFNNKLLKFEVLCSITPHCISLILPCPPAWWCSGYGCPHNGMNSNGLLGHSTLT